MKPIFADNNSVTSNRIILTPSALAKRSFLYVQECGYLKSLKSHASTRERMNSFLMFYVLSGEGFFTYKEKSTRIAQGACVYIDCMEKYTHESTSDKPWELLWVHFYGGASKEYYEYFSSHHSSIIYLADESYVYHCLQRLITLNKEKQPFFEMNNSCILVELITILITNPQKLRRNALPLLSSEEKLIQIWTYLDTHCEEPITLDTLSATFFISKYHLCREFKRKYGETIQSSLLNKRITMAKELLRFTNETVSSIAIQCGIPDGNYFIKQFKKLENMTPGEFRKKWGR